MTVRRRLFMGIDPGREGAWAVIGADGVGLAVGDLPYADKRLDLAALLDDWRYRIGISEVRPAITEVRAALEHPMAFGHEAPSTALRAGMNFGILIGALTVREIPFLDPQPSGWKQKMHLTSDKERSRSMALQLFPNFAQELRYKKNHGRAEALLLAEWLRRRELGIRTPRE